MLKPLAKDALRWRLDPETLEFGTTAEVEPVIGFAGQDTAVDALRFGIECAAPEQNVFVRGQTGLGRMSIITRLLEEIRPDCNDLFDYAYVHDFKEPDHPKLLKLPPGRGKVLHSLVHDVARFIREELPKTLTGEAIQTQREAIETETNAKIAEITKPFEADLREAGMAMVQQGQPPAVQTHIVPLFDGKPLGGAELAQLLGEEKITQEQISEWETKQAEFAKRFGGIGREIQRMRVETGKRMLSLIEDSTRELVEDAVAPIRKDFAEPAVQRFVDSLIDDVIENLGREHPPGFHPADLYDVNVILESTCAERAPVVIETSPSLSRLLGSVETGWSPQGPTRGDFRRISAGSILKASGGYLVMEARDLLTEPGAWRVLVRTLRNKELEIVPQELSTPYFRTSIKPEPIPISLRVILIGDAGTYYMLDRADPDFGQLFKVLADFESEIDRDAEGLRQYASVIAKIAANEDLPPFDRSAVAALAEHGARIAARRDKLTARFGRIADIAREAVYVAHQRERNGAARGAITGDDIRETVRRTKARANLPSRRFHAMIANGTIIIETDGATVGQVNGLAVIKAGMLTYGFPARITATIAPGNAGIIDIESSASLSGQIHTKGFQILGGLLRYLLRADHAMAFSASLAFEQSYGGIDGDSASGAEICCLLSALTGVPLRQDVAMTGAIDQHGRIQAIGGVNEKIEGFFDTCEALGTSGHGGVIIPASNAGDLMLRHDVVEACAEGRFHVWAVKTVHEALEVFTGMEAGSPDEEGRYPEATLLGIAQSKARHFWERSLTSPTAYARAMAQLEGSAQAGGDVEA
ncbi:Lon protease [Planctomycetes bacterium Poly30]|uniref:endopeptidase La n=1 Tax=Saltatorellus ferox TaxID=2528018 RepID=A0A518F0L6_9BACT|nr:Lon protease [Planctomycetes bacterium Poly30]